MPLLDAALAFAITMLVVATVVTQLVDIIQGIAGLRKKDLQKLLDEFSENEVMPVIESELARLGTKLTASGITVTRATLDATVNTADVENVDDATAEVKAKATAEVKAKLKAESTSRIHVSTKELLEHLKHTQVGGELLIKLGDDAQVVFDEVGRRYEEFGDKFTALFRERARIIGTMVALFLAFALNVDSINVFRAYVSNQSLHESVVAKASEYDKSFTEHEKQVAEKKANLSPDQVNQLTESVSQFRTQLSDLKSAGFPIGWSQFPGLNRDKAKPGDWVVWIAGIFLTGALAGLGAPFWNDVVRGLVSITQRSRDDKTP